MNSPTALRDRWVLHFTHIDNLPNIVSDERLLCDAAAGSGRLRAEVGDPQIKASRRGRSIPVGRGGYVCDYVPFYFAPRSPMMYRIACDHRDSVPGRYPDGDRPLAYLAVRVGAVVDAALDWVGTDGNAATATTEFTTDLDRLDAMVDWPLMTATRWNNVPDDPDRQRRRMAELLIYGQVPLSVVHQIGTYSEEYARNVRGLLGNHPLTERVVVREQWYYGFQKRG